MAFSLSNGTSISSFVELNQNSQFSQIQLQESSDHPSSRASLAGNRSDTGFCSSAQGANVTTSSNQNSTSSIIKNRGDQPSSSSSYQQQQSTLIQNASLAYPFLYPTSYLPGFTQTTTTAQYNYSSAGVGNGTMQNSQSSSGASNNRRGGKKKVTTTQSQNPEMRLFFNLRRRDSQVQTNKGQSHVYKPKNPPTLSEWFRRLSIEERVNALSTVCPHLTETFINMFQRIDQSGQSSFARKANPSSSEQKHFQTPSYMPAYPGFGSFFSYSGSDSSMSSFEEVFYHRPSSEAEYLTIKHSEKEKLEAEKEILKHVRVTDYQSCLDTLTVSEELVADADYFFRLMSYATNNQAFSLNCQFETKQQNVTSIEQPSWFKPKSFHTFATWIIVALEENLWAHYNYDNNANLGNAKVNDISLLFQEKSDKGAQDVDIQQLAQFWRDTPEKDKKVLIDQLKAAVVKEAEQEYNLNHSGHSKSKVVHSKHMQYSVQIKEKPEKQQFHDQVDIELKWLVDYSLKTGIEMELITTLMYTRFDKYSQRYVNMSRKFLDLIKKKFKDDLMDNLLQEEQTVKTSKSFKKKKNKKNFNSNNQQSAQAAQSTDKVVNQSSTENTALNSDTLTDDQQKPKPKKKKGKQALPASDKVNGNMSSQEQQKNNTKSKKKGAFKKQPQNFTIQDTNSSDEQQPTKHEETNEREDTHESDHKNSSNDTKSSINLYDLATAHQSNNSNSNSSVTFKSQLEEPLTISEKIKSHTTTGNILQVQSSKSLDLNPSFSHKSFNGSPFKQQKGKIESKNYQILQNSQHTENKHEEKKRDAKVFSEDKAKKVGDEIIKNYILELTNNLINEVCRKIEKEEKDKQALKVIEEQKRENIKSNKLSSLLSQKLSPDQIENDNPKQNNHRNYGKKQRKESNQQNYNYSQKNNEQQQEEKCFRKKSFNQKKYLKEEKKFSEDYADSTNKQIDEQNPEVSNRKPSHNEQNKGQRKGFGIHLKTDKQEENRGTGKQESSEWVKGTAKTDANTQKKKVQNQKRESDVISEQEPIKYRTQNNIDLKQKEEVTDASSCKDDTMSQQNKKKRTKKKSKLTDIDIMNNFMKSLHAHNEDDANKANSQASSYNKKPFNAKSSATFKGKPSFQAEKVTDVQQSTSLKKEQLTEEEPKPSARPYRPRYSQKIPQNIVEKTHQKKPSFDEPQQPVEQSKPEEIAYPSRKNSMKMKRPVQKIIQKPQEFHHDGESEYSNKADCKSDKSSTSLQDQINKQETPSNTNRSNPFRHINFQQTANECDNTSLTDGTATTNTAADTSLENNNFNNCHSKYQSHQNTPLKGMNSLSKNYQKQNTTQSLYCNDQESASYRTPPHHAKKQITQTNYSHNGQNYRKGHHNGQQLNHQVLNTFENQYHAQANFTQGYNQSHGAHHKNTHNHRANPQYRQVSRHQSNNIYVQPMNITQSMQEQQQQQYMQTFMHPENNTIFYQDQSMLMNPPQNVDTYNQKQTDQIFQYIEKAPMTLQQPIPSYSPSQYPMNQYAPMQQNDMLPNPFNYQRMSAPYFDQSQDLIFQIFNSIKSNHSMSPIPQMISPPPLLDFQMSQCSDLSFGAAKYDSVANQESQLYQLLDQEIEQYTKQIEQNINTLKPERDYVYNKLTEIANQVFQGQKPKLELFGSLITGLALESSDMDLAVTGLKIDDRFVMIQELNNLANALQDWQVLESFKSIETASIPVIKMKVDLNKLREMEMQDIFKDQVLLPIPESQRLLSVDITFDDSPIDSLNNGQSTSDILGSSSMKTHLGLQSCALVQYYIQNYRSLKQVAILLKKFLAVHGFNSTYYGGISSYSAVILIVAYMNYYGIRDAPEWTPSRLLMGFLDFYGNYFNPSSTGISVYDDGSFFSLNSLLDSNFVILDPLNLQNNTTKNSYLTKEILLKFQSAFNNLKSLMYKLPSLQQAVSSTQTAFSRTNSQDQKSSIPFDKASPLPSIFQPASNYQETSISQFVQASTSEAEDRCGLTPLSTVPEEHEASNLASGDTTGQQINSPLSCQVSLLETFFAKEAQPVTNLIGLSTSQTEPRGTQNTMIEDAHVQ